MMDKLDEIWKQKTRKKYIEVMKKINKRTSKEEVRK